MGTFLVFMMYKTPYIIQNENSSQKIVREIVLVRFSILLYTLKIHDDKASAYIFSATS